MTKCQLNPLNPARRISALLVLHFMISSTSAVAGDPTRHTQFRDITTIEEAIAEADADELPRLETEIAGILQRDPSNINGNYLMSVLLLRMFTLDPGSYTLIRQSTELAAQTYDLDRKSDLSIAALASILETSGEVERGLALINDSYKKGIPLGWRTYLAQARLLFTGKNSDVVLKILDKVLKSPDASPSLVAPTLISVLTSEHDGDRQIQSLQSWSKRCPSLSMDLAIANALAVNARYSEAAAVYSKIIAKYPRNTESLISLGIITLRHEKNAAAAIEQFKKAISVAKAPRDKSTAETHLALALIAQNPRLKDTNDASIQAIRSAGDQEGILIAILSAYRRHGSTEATLNFLSALEDAVPGMHLAHALKAEILNEKFGRHFEAMRSFTNAIALDPTRSEYYNGRGLAWMGLKNIESALADFETASATNPEDASARYNVACAHARLGHSEEALASLTRAVEMDDRLLDHARGDMDLVILRSNPSFKALFEREINPVSLAH